jgi:hypothetical protein
VLAWQGDAYPKNGDRDRVILPASGAGARCLGEPSEQDIGTGITLRVVTRGPSDEDLEELRLAQRTIERITAIPEDRWAALPDERVKAFNDELTKCGVLVTRFKETHGHLPR